MKYFVFPIVEQRSTNIPLCPEAVDLPAALKQIEQRVEMLTHQGYWLDIRRQRIEPKNVGFHLVTEAEFNEQTEP